MEIQRKLGSDIAMVFDECPRIRVKRIVLDCTRTLDWAAICRGPRAKSNCFWHCAGAADLRESCAKALVEMDFEEYAIGGVSVGEPEDLI